MIYPYIMRKAFIGLSTPLGYDYGNQASKAPADLYSSPNPILDSPFGLLLLFDELVFVSRSLCPENMRSLPYVSFLDELSNTPLLTEEEYESAIVVANTVLERTISTRVTSFPDTLRNTGAFEKMMIDNHSHGLTIGNVRGIQANPDFYNIAVDTLIYSKIHDPSLEMVLNTRFESKARTDYPAGSQARLTELLVIENIPNYLSLQGPYHPVIEEVRNNSYLRDFRKWIVTQQGQARPSEAEDIKRAVENELKNAQETLFLKQFDRKRHFKSIAKAMIGDAIGILIPPIGTITAIGESIVDEISSQNRRWQGFVIDSRRLLRKESI